ncbi:MAG: hypothetical protein ACE5GO_09275 [Anaerolineales bacterium]
MLRGVQVDVPGKRGVAVDPQAIFIPLFRDMPLFQERDFGTFVPIWAPETVASEAEGSVLTVPQLASLTRLPEQPAAWPFVGDNPLRKRDDRLFPGLRQALALFRKRGLTPEMLVQAISPWRGPLPTDVRQWPLTATDVLINEAALARPPESTDVFATQFLLWDHLLAGTFERARELLAQAFRVTGQSGSGRPAGLAAFDAAGSAGRCPLATGGGGRAPGGVHPHLPRAARPPGA